MSTAHLYGDDVFVGEFSIYSGHTRGTGYYTGGQTGGTGEPDYLSTSPVMLESGHPISVKLMYVNGVLRESLVDTVTNDTFNTQFAVDIQSTVANSVAFVGFTGATGGSTSTQTISDFSYSVLESPAPALSFTSMALVVALLSLFGTYRLRRQR